MTNAPESRKTHIVRLLGTNKAGEVLPDIWLDVERIDSAKSATQTAEGYWQGVQRKLFWADDPDVHDYSEDGPPSRLTKIVKVCDPNDNVDDPEVFIKIRVIKALKSKGGSAGDQNYMDRLVNDELTRARKVVTRRIVHYDTNIDAEAQAAFDADPTRKAYVVPGDRYQKDLNTKDDSQHVEHEIIEYLKPATNERNQVGDVSRGMQVKLLNQYLIDESDPAQGDVVGANGINPPYRLDPYQNIVNVQFASVDQQWLLGKDAFDAPNLRAESKDGRTWNNVKFAASGAGFTVLSGGPIAFGKGKFLRANVPIETDSGNNPVYLGIASSGTINWTVAWTAPGDVVAISLANDEFFVTYKSGPFDPFLGDGIQPSSIALLAISKDGVNFTTGINPFPIAAALDGGEIGGNVVYSKNSKRYVIIAGGEANGTDPFSGNDSLRSASSSDGLSWSEHIESSSYDGIGQCGVFVGTIGAFLGTTVAYGKDLFVAATSKKNRFANTPVGFPPMPRPDYILHSCSVAVSIDGSNWSEISLPGAVVRSSLELGDRGGDTTAIVFVQTRNKDDSYFVATGTESGGSSGDTIEPDIEKMWVSSDGRSWSLIRSESTPALNATIDTVLSAIAANPSSKIIIV